MIIFQDAFGQFLISLITGQNFLIISIACRKIIRKFVNKF